MTTASSFNALKRIRTELAQLEAQGLQRSRHLLESPQGAHVRVDGRDLLSFCSNDYLGLANHPALIAAASLAAHTNGVGTGASHLITGHHVAHLALETRIAEFIGLPGALLFSTGYMANIGVVTALVGRDGEVFADRLNHASLNDAALLSRAKFTRYPHNDLLALERQLAASQAAQKLVLVDAVYSMDGDLAPLPDLLALCERYDAWLLVDDAHGLGVLGPGGAGSLEQAGLVQRDVPLLMATLGKALGCSGAFVAGPSAWIEGLVQFARTYVYTTAMPPALAAAALVAVQRAQAESWRRDKLAALVARFRRGATELGLALMNSSSAIQPLLLGSAEAAMTAMQALEVQGLLVTAIRPPTVPGGQARLRITLSASHEEAHVDRLLAALETLRPPGRSG